MKKPYEWKKHEMDLGMPTKMPMYYYSMSYVTLAPATVSDNFSGSMYAYVTMGDKEWKAKLTVSKTSVIEKKQCLDSREFHAVFPTEKEAKKWIDFIAMEYLEGNRA